ncbi:Potassium voltage-gated channel subfamily A member 4 [Tetrabaena socialis]|uniref:Potassium voltage-gated channel subfamily A member 4 n=1 Tax=Tetrabaena socialis TaxID=47790 RepID=A0A2J7ZNS2_9CHLO|nr:Potassium voltage-gated channel subfamily A member 4 [Tetrabaena socialis]|eukprot:PNH01919.1 Potassium voltage-gated channel subfamily A member 4 [Tetrabaena socialis]
MLVLMAFFVSLIVVTAATLLFFAERGVYDEALGYYVREHERYFTSDGDPIVSPFESIPAGFWWAIVTVMTVGYGDVVPISVGGRFVASFTMLCGEQAGRGLVSASAAPSASGRNRGWALARSRVAAVARTSPHVGSLGRMASALHREFSEKARGIGAFCCCGPAEGALACTCDDTGIGGAQGDGARSSARVAFAAAYAHPFAAANTTTTTTATTTTGGVRHASADGMYRRPAPSIDGMLRSASVVHRRAVPTRMRRQLGGASGSFAGAVAAAQAADAAAGVGAAGGPSAGSGSGWPDASVHGGGVAVVAPDRTEPEANADTTARLKEALSMLRGTWLHDKMVSEVAETLAMEEEVHKHWLQLVQAASPSGRQRPPPPTPGTHPPRPGEATEERAPEAEGGELGAE